MYQSPVLPLQGSIDDGAHDLLDFTLEHRLGEKRRFVPRPRRPTGRVPARAWGKAFVAALLGLLDFRRFGDV